MVCFPNWQAAHLGTVLNLEAVLWRPAREAVARSPRLRRNLILLKAKCPNRWCHRSSSFSGSDRLKFSLWTEATVAFSV